MIPGERLVTPSFASMSIARVKGRGLGGKLWVVVLR